MYFQNSGALEVLLEMTFFQFCYLYTPGADSSTPHQIMRGLQVLLSPFHLPLLLNFIGKLDKNFEFMDKILITN
jgi:hypothetical protein